jgi:hypothetical protein
MANHDEILDRFVRGDGESGLGSQEKADRRPRGSGKTANLLTVRLSSGISANILDFRVPQKHVLTEMPAWRPTARLVVVKS